MIGFLTNPGSSLIRSLKSDPHPAFRSSCPFVFRLLRKNLVNPSIESYPARQRRSYSSAAGMARTSATIRNSPLTPPENQVSIPVKVKGNNNRDRSQPNYLKIAVASCEKRLLYQTLHEYDIMNPGGGMGRRLRFKCVSPHGSGGSRPRPGTEHWEAVIPCHFEMAIGAMERMMERRAGSLRPMVMKIMMNAFIHSSSF